MSSGVTAATVLAAVYEAVDRLNETLPPDRRVVKSPETRLGEPDGLLDSIGIVNFIVEAELAVEERLGVRIDLADERALSQTVHPLQSIATLARYIQSLIDSPGSR